MPTFIGSSPNVILFQFNPETITHTWTPAPPDPQANKDPLAVKGIPGEEFSFSLALNSNDAIADSDANQVAAGLAIVSGIYPRLAALEMLQYPSRAFDGGLVGQVSAAANAAGAVTSGAARAAAGAVGGDTIASAVSATVCSAAKKEVPASHVPTVLFVWGPQRIVPVRVTNLAITEKLYDRMLNPTQADVQITLRVLTLDELGKVEGALGLVARVAYKYSQGLRQTHAVANLGDPVGSVIGMLPNSF
ncbi:hypothetical protein [Nitrosospira multiformis]|nr:hypothetical protein [Nitrosospira multiformis]